MKGQRTGHGRTLSRGSREKGIVLALATTVIAAVMILALPFLTKLFVEHGTSGKESKAISALCLAEAGVDKAISELNTGSWVGTESQTTNLTMTLDDFQTPGGAIVGDVDITVMPFNNADKTRLVVATGSVRHRGPAQVAQTVTVTLLKPAAYVIKSWQEPSSSL